VDDEPSLQGLPDPKPDERVTVDHQAIWGLAQDCFPFESFTQCGGRGLRGAREPILPSRRVR
jgi:hypothetical protein